MKDFNVGDRVYVEHRDCEFHYFPEPEICIERECVIKDIYYQNNDYIFCILDKQIGNEFWWWSKSDFTLIEEKKEFYASSCISWVSPYTKLKCYYAHSLHIYNTPQEKRDIELLEKLGFEVVNPNTSEHQKGYEESGGMEYFRRIVEECDLIAFRGLSNGKIGAGVFKEITKFNSENKPVIELPNSILQRGLSVEETREFLKENGQR